MSVYAIGDLQGCFDELNDLLDEINFDENKDLLWFCGDLVNRGPQSLEVLRFVKQLGDKAVTILGNHDLHLVAVANNPKKKRSKDTLDSILKTPDKEELIKWLQRLPLIHHDNELAFTLIHAGLPPQRDINQATELAAEVETALRGKEFSTSIDDMYGNSPDRWSDDLTDWDRLRFIINCFTRMRYCNKKGQIDMQEKGPPGSQRKSLLPWFSVPSRKSKNHKIIFGHWSTVHLGNIKDFTELNVYPLDTGCFWGDKLTALRLNDEKWFSVPSKQNKSF